MVPMKLDLIFGLKSWHCLLRGAPGNPNPIQQQPRAGDNHVKKSLIRLRPAWAICIVLLSGVLFPVMVGAENGRPQVVWRVTDWPPFYIREGPQEGRGLYDQMIAEYQAALPQFEHLSLEMNTLRALQQMRDRDSNRAVCHASMLRGPLVGFAHISDLNSILLPHVIIARKSAEAEIRSLAEEGSEFVSVEKLFLHQPLKGAYSAYGTHSVLEKFRYQEFAHVTMTAENYQNMGQLLANGRVDYVVQYAPFLTYTIKPESVDEFVTIPIEESKDAPYVKVYVGCTHNTIGKDVIDGINKVLAGKPKLLQKARVEWYPPEEQHKLKTLYEELAPNLNDY